MGWLLAASGCLRVRQRPRTEEIAGQLKGFSGILQVDGYAAYKALARDHGGAIQLAFCLAHARRKFVEVFKTTQSPFAREVIERLQAVCKRLAVTLLTRA
ncbi:IS66 family transposase [Bradyrhizobium barranii]|uniref:IS66 family transposase n=1 Tax=Bradyrhizobium barranii TaxID=2992140 RepID=UPI0024C029CD|nr:transposase [Bradyrhizobium japonicum]